MIFSKDLLISVLQVAEEGDIGRVTVAEREQAKRNYLLWKERKWQRVQVHMKRCWAKWQEKEEALRLEEELRYTSEGRLKRASVSHPASIPA